MKCNFNKLHQAINSPNRRATPILKLSVPPNLQYSPPISKSADPEQQQLLQQTDSNIHGDDNAQPLDTLASTEQAYPVAAVPPNFKSRNLRIFNSSETRIGRRVGPVLRGLRVEAGGQKKLFIF